MFGNSNTWSEHPTDNMDFKPYNRLNFKPVIANWYDSDSNCEEEQEIIHFSDCHCNLYDYPHNENLHYEEDTSFFPDINGNIVRFNQDDEILEQEYIEKMCFNCGSIQDNNVLFQTCMNEHYLCSECYDKEKAQCLRQNAEYERQQRINKKQIQIKPYQFTCSICHIKNKLNFNIHIRDYYHDIEILQAYKN